MASNPIPPKASEPASQSLHELLDLPDATLQHRLLHFIRQFGIKFRSRAVFDQIGWKGAPAPAIARFWCRKEGTLLPSTDPLIWDLRAPLLHDEALACGSILLWRRCRAYKAQWIGGLETAAIPIVAGILAVNRAAGASPLNGFYLRKKRKPDGLCRLLEGVPPPHGTRVLLVDDILNRGISKKPLLAYCRNNGLQPAALLVIVDTERKGRDLSAPVCPVEAIFTRRVVLGGPRQPEDQRVEVPAIRVSIPSDRPNRTNIAVHPDSGPRTIQTGAEMTPEDIELVRLARDAVIFAALSKGKRHPTLREDLHGSAGYLPFLGRYLRERGPVFTRISKREFKNGVWFNRLRGCQCVGLFDPKPGIVADMTIKSAIASATRARKVKPGAAAFHKPIWPAEIGDLSLFVYVVEKLVPTKARTARELLSEGHDVNRWGLVAHSNGYRGAVCGGLDAVPDIDHQIATACHKMQNGEEIRPHKLREVSLTRMKGRWLWDPIRSKPDFF